MKKVLIVSYNYPPVGNIGRVRATKLAGYLPKYGWSSTVLTVTKDRTKWGNSDPAEGILPGVKVIRAPFPDILTYLRDVLVSTGLKETTDTTSVESYADRKNPPGAVKRTARVVLDTARWWIALPDRYALWIPFAVARGLRELRRGGYSLILSTSPPVSNHVVASVLHRLSGLPWVADFRDPWSHPYLELGPNRLLVNRMIERATLRNAVALTAVTEPFVERLELLGHPRPGGVVFIPNGFDPNDYNGEVEVLKDKFVFTYTGSLLGLKQDPRPLLRVVGELIDEGGIGAEEILFRFFGPLEQGFLRFCEEFKYPGIVRQEGVVSRTEAIRHQQESTALLVLLWDHSDAAGIYPGKIFEYLGAKRPILAWSPAGRIIGELLQRTGAGLAVSDTDALKTALTAWFDEFHSTGELAYHSNSEEIERFSWQALSGRFAELFDNLDERYRHPTWQNSEK